MTTMFESLRSRTTPIGADLGSCAVRLVQATPNGDRFVVQNAAQSERTLAASDTDPRATRRLLNDCHTKTRFHGRAVVAALSTPELAFHALELPRAALQAGDDGLVRIEVERLSTRSQGDFETRHWVVPTTGSSGPNAIAVEAGHGAVNAAIESCADCKLDCIAVEAGAAALIRFASLARPSDPKTIRGVLDLGGRQSRLIVFADESPLLVRTTGTGGRAWTQRIVDALQITLKAAEVHKRSHGICRTGSTRDDDDRSELPSMLLGALRLDLNELAGEVKRSFEYVLGCHPSCRAGDLMLVGGGARLRNLPAFLTQALGIEIAPASEYVAAPTSRIIWPESMHDPVEPFALAIGLAVGDES